MRRWSWLTRKRRKGMRDGRRRRRDGSGILRVEVRPDNLPWEPERCRSLISCRERNFGSALKSLFRENSYDTYPPSATDIKCHFPNRGCFFFTKSGDAKVAKISVNMPLVVLTLCSRASHCLPSPMLSPEGILCHPPSTLKSVRTKAVNTNKRCRFLFSSPPHQHPPRCRLLA